MGVEKKSAFRLYLTTIRLFWREKLEIFRLLSPILVFGLVWISLPLTSIGIVPLVLIYCVGLYSFVTCTVQMHRNIILDQDFHESKIFSKIQKCCCGNPFCMRGYISTNDRDITKNIIS